MVGWTELAPPPFVGAGVRYRDVMAVLDGALPEGTDIVVDAGNTVITHDLAGPDRSPAGATFTDGKLAGRLCEAARAESA